MHSPRGIPTSRAYWDLKADEMMNRIFDPEPTIDLEVEEVSRHRTLGASLVPRALPPGPVVAEPLPEAAAVRPTTARSPRPDTNALLLTVLGGVCMVSVASSVLYLRHWSQAQQTLQQERNLLLVERLRELGPANPQPLAAQAPAPTPLPLAAGAHSGSLAQLPGAAGAAQSLDLPPPPPEEPWMEQLEELPGGGGRAPLLRVPISPRLGTAAPPAGRPGPSPASAPVPDLLGVVAAPGRAGSAIFQAGSSSSNVGVGETIGASGWRLRSVQGDAVTIERGGEVRRLSLGAGT